MTTSLSLLAFTLGQVCYAILSVFLWIWFVSRRESKTGMNLPDFFTNMNFPPFDFIQLVSTFVVQTIMIVVLQEGDKIVMSKLSISATDKGIYALVSNLGSLIVRFLFLPVERTAFSEFTSWDQTEYTTKQRLLAQTIMKMMFFIGFLAFVFGPHFSFMLLDVIYGTTWSQTDAPLVLGWYFRYLIILSLNGTTEAFAKSSMTVYQMFCHNLYLLLCFGGFASVMFIFSTNLRTLILANAIN